MTKRKRDSQEGDNAHWPRPRLAPSASLVSWFCPPPVVHAPPLTLWDRLRHHSCFRVRSPLPLPRPPSPVSQETMVRARVQALVYAERYARDAEASALHLPVPWKVNIPRSLPLRWEDEPDGEPRLWWKAWSIRMHRHLSYLDPGTGHEVAEANRKVLFQGTQGEVYTVRFQLHDGPALPTSSSIHDGPPVALSTPPQIAKVCRLAGANEHILTKSFLLEALGYAVLPPPYFPRVHAFFFHPETGRPIVVMDRYTSDLVGEINRTLATRTGSPSHSTDTPPALSTSSTHTPPARSFPVAQNPTLVLQKTGSHSPWSLSVSARILQTLRLVWQMGHALMFLHDKGLLHGDIKPDNILVDHDNFRLADFGFLTVMPPVERDLWDTDVCSESMASTVFSHSTEYAAPLASVEGKSVPPEPAPDKAPVDTHVFLPLPRRSFFLTEVGTDLYEAPEVVHVSQHYTVPPSYSMGKRNVSRRVSRADPSGRPCTHSDCREALRLDPNLCQHVEVRRYGMPTDMFALGATAITYLTGIHREATQTWGESLTEWMAKTSIPMECAIQWDMLHMALRTLVYPNPRGRASAFRLVQFLRPILPHEPCTCSISRFPSCCGFAGTRDPLYYGSAQARDPSYDGFAQARDPLYYGSTQARDPLYYGSTQARDPTVLQLFTTYIDKDWIHQDPPWHTAPPGPLVRSQCVSSLSNPRPMSHSPSRKAPVPMDSLWKDTKPPPWPASMMREWKHALQNHVDPVHFALAIHLMVRLGDRLAPLSPASLRMALIAILRVLSKMLSVPSPATSHWRQLLHSIRWTTPDNAPQWTEACTTDWQRTLAMACHGRWFELDTVHALVDAPCTWETMDTWMDVAHRSSLKRVLG